MLVIEQLNYSLKLLIDVSERRETLHAGPGYDITITTSALWRSPWQRGVLQ